MEDKDFMMEKQSRGSIPLENASGRDVDFDESSPTYDSQKKKQKEELLPLTVQKEYDEQDEVKAVKNNERLEDSDKKAGSLNRNQWKKFMDIVNKSKGKTDGEKDKAEVKFQDQSDQMIIRNFFYVLRAQVLDPEFNAKCMETRNPVDANVKFHKKENLINGNIASSYRESTVFHYRQSTTSCYRQSTTASRYRQSIRSRYRESIAYLVRESMASLAKESITSLIKESITSLGKENITPLDDKAKCKILRERHLVIMLVKEFYEKCKEMRCRIQPMFELVKNGTILSERAVGYIKQKYHALFGYCKNIIFYLSLKKKKINTIDHIVQRRIVRYIVFLNRLNRRDKISERQFDIILKKQQRNEPLSVMPDNKNVPQNMKREETKASNGRTENEKHVADKEIDIAALRKRIMNHENALRGLKRRRLF